MTTAELDEIRGVSMTKRSGAEPMIRAHFTGDKEALVEVTWEKRTSKITEADGTVVFQMDDVEVPSFFSQLATDIAASKYFRKAGLNGDKNLGERSWKQVIHRVAHTIRIAGEERGYFSDGDEAQVFEDELTYMLTHQVGAFNSPVFFNCGLWHEYGIENRGGTWVFNEDYDASLNGGNLRPEIYEVENSYERPQCSACFIQTVDDDLMKIFELLKNEARLFNFGSGTGSNFSRIRSKYEKLSGGGTSSGLMSFLEVFDRGAGTIKSGGRTRRAAKMVCLDMDHPEIVDFIEWKVREEKKAQALIGAGWASDFNGEAYHTVSGQNANNSVRVTDQFMSAVDGDRDWHTHARTTKQIVQTYKARDLWDKIAEAAWSCADPGVQYDTTINAWHTCPNTDRIRSSNPCCFTGDMLVDTSEGLISFETLESMCRRGEELPYAFAFDKETNLPVLRRIRKAWVAGATQRLVEVRTDRGLTLRCTPEHRFLLRSGEYVEARDLMVGARLRKIGRSSNAKRSNRRVLYHRVLPSAANGTVYQNRFVWEQVHGEIPDGWHVHHKNEDPTDDRLSNLELRMGDEHVAHHTQGVNNPRFLDVDNSVLIEVWEDIEANIERDRLRQRATMERISSLRKLGLSYAQIAAKLDGEGVPPPRAASWGAGSVSALVKQGYAGRKDAKVTVARWNAYVHSNGLEGAVPLANIHGIQGRTWTEFETWIEEHRADVNDGVASVTEIPCDSPHRVYDIEVESVHNFGVTCPEAATLHSIVVSNSEYMFLDDTACNLASLNLTKFLGVDGEFDVASYRHAIRVFTLAQEILVDFSSYPTATIAKNSHDYRPLGLGYANLGTMLMISGIPYDSDNGRAIASALTAILTGHAYRTSAEIAARRGAFAGFAMNRAPMLDVMRKHRHAVYAIDIPACPRPLAMAAREDWDDVMTLGEKHGFRNAQATVIAPTGTIGLLMDCDTTGVEPDFSLVKYKKLAGGGMVKIVNQSVGRALRKLGFSDLAVENVLAWVAEHDTIEGCPVVPDSMLPVFDCANRCGKNGTRCLSPMAHLTMMAAVQPFVSGAISKTVNLPREATVEDVKNVYYQGWKLGLKAVALYRDGCKASQPLNSTSDAKVVAPKDVSKLDAPAGTATLASKLTAEEKLKINAAYGKMQNAVAEPRSTRPAQHRVRLPQKRKGITQVVRVGGHKIFVRTGEYEDGSLGEIFIDMHKEGATLRSMMNSFAMAVSVGLQHGVPLESFVKLFTFTRFEPAGPVEGHDNIRMATSLMDYVFRHLAIEYLGRHDLAHVKPFTAPTVEPAEHGPDGDASAPSTRASMLPSPAESAIARSFHGGRTERASADQHHAELMGDAPPCDVCGHITIRNGTCYRCTNCGNSMGCS